MHLSLAAVRAHLADKNATWSDGVARWSEGGRDHLLAWIEGPLTADAVVDAHVRALAAQRSTLTLAFGGAATAVARRTAARFGIALLDATTLPAAPEPAPVPTAALDAAWSAATHAFERVARAPAVGFELGEDVASAWSAALDALAPPVGAPTPPAAEFPLPPAGFFRALEREPRDFADAAEAFAALDALVPAAPVVAPPAAPELILAASEPEPEVAHADPALPWDLSLSAPEPEPVAVEAAELAAMPWNLHTEQHELLPAGRKTRAPTPRPTAIAQDWGLPWPRPVVPTGGIAIADPRLWHAKERIETVREDLQRAGAPSFGAVKPEGSAWLKRLSEFGAP